MVSSLDKVRILVDDLNLALGLNPPDFDHRGKLVLEESWENKSKYMYLSFVSDVDGESYSLVKKRYETAFVDNYQELLSESFYKELLRMLYSGFFNRFILNRL